MSRENYRHSRKKQQLRRLRELNEKSEIALWFLESWAQAVFPYGPGGCH